MFACDDISDVLRDLYRAASVPVCVFEDGKLLLAISEDPECALPESLLKGLPESLPRTWHSRTEDDLLFAGMEPSPGTLIFLGPVLPYPCSREKTRKLQESLPFGQDLLARYLNSHSHVLLSVLDACLSLLGRILCGHPLGDPGSLSFHSSTENLSRNLTFAEDVLNRTQPMEQQILSAVCRGDTAETDRLLSYIGTGSSIAQDDQPLHRYYLVGSISLASRAAIEGGADYGYAIALQNKYFAQILHTRSFAENSMIFLNAFHSYAAMVEKIRKEGTSPLSRKVAGYIQSHLYEKITPTLIAAALQMNVSYLCTAYKKECGRTISAAVHAAKMEEAKLLLGFENASILGISELLCYSSESYFCDVFRRTEGVTPGEYRKRKLQG